MTTQPQSCRECRHANINALDVIHCEWAWAEDVVCPPWLLNEAQPVEHFDGADCPAFERREPVE